MSKDILLLRECDHIIVRERVELEMDLRQIVIPRSLGNFQVVVRLFGTDLPQDNSENSWHLEKNPLSVSPTGMKIVFDKEWDSLDDYHFDLTYTTTLQECVKCNSLGVLDDQSVDGRGRATYLANEDKLSQDALKIITTLLSSNVFHTWYGTSLDSLIGTKVDNSTFKLRITEEVLKAMQNLRSLQNQQSRVQEVSAREWISSVDDVQVIIDQNDPTLIEISVRITTQAGSQVEVVAPFTTADTALDQINQGKGGRV